MNLNPNSGVADLEKLSLNQQGNFLDNRIGRYLIWLNQVELALS